MRVRQFTMKDSYSFDIDEAGLDVSTTSMMQTYRRIFDRCGLKYVVVDAHSGAMGGSKSQEFMVHTDAGEDLVATARSAATRRIWRRRRRSWMRWKRWRRRAMGSLSWCTRRT